uniref:Uncharacterized protein n=1 Tax=Panagrolaimus sp. PS1159 TaxID=55785 RepID=A0AC35FWA9_9BILA
MPSKLDSGNDYRCFWNIIHVKYGIQIVGILQAAFTIMGLFIFLVPHNFNTILGILEVLSIIGEVLGIIVLFLGIKKESSNCLLFFIVFECLTVLISIAFFICGIFAFSDPNGSSGHILAQIVDFTFGNGTADKLGLTNFELNAILTILSSFFSILFFTWYIKIVYRYYIYLCDLKKIGQNPMPQQIRQKYTLGPNLV